MEKQQILAMTTAPDILAPYLVHFDTKPNAIESVQIYEKCLNDIQTDFTERLEILRKQHEDVRIIYNKIEIRIKKKKNFILGKQRKSESQTIL